MKVVITNAETLSQDGSSANGGPDEKLERLLYRLFPGENKRSLSHRARTYVYHQGDAITSFYFLVKGMVALERLDNSGRMAILGIARQGSILSWTEFFERGHYSCSAQAISPCEIVAIPRVDFLSKLQRHIDLLSAVMHNATHQLEAYEDHIFRLSTLEVPERLYSTLCNFAEGNCDGSHGREVDLPLRKREIAALIGTTPEGISRSLKRLEEINAIEVGKGEVVRLHTRGHGSS
ncbi:MAG: Crp/Fnr family transcriptional regulator [Rhodospirillales bacterium]|jgi:CRP/FNR family transcriptional regulator|nr:Crp/Fnr family transcriptional regulator [Rhodospirillales bacterium]